MASKKTQHKRRVVESAEAQRLHHIQRERGDNPTTHLTNRMRNAIRAQAREDAAEELKGGEDGQRDRDSN